MTSPRFLAPALRYGALDHSPRIASPLAQASGVAGSSSSGSSSSRSGSPSSGPASRDGSLSSSSDSQLRSSISSQLWLSGKFSSRGSFASNPPEAQFSRESLSGCSGLDLTLDMDGDFDLKNEKSPMLPRPRYARPATGASPHYKTLADVFRNPPRLSLHSMSIVGLGKIATAVVLMLLLAITMRAPSNEATKQLSRSGTVATGPYESMPSYRRNQLLGAHPSSLFETEGEDAEMFSGRGVSAKGEVHYGEALYLNRRPNPPPKEADVAFAASNTRPIEFSSAQLRTAQKAGRKGRGGQVALNDDESARGGSYRGYEEIQILNYDKPQASLRSQLKEGWRYVTSLSSGGHSLQILSDIKLLYYAQLSRRAAIIPTLTPTYIADGAPESITTFYDLNRFMNDSNILAVSMADAKLRAHESKGRDLAVERLGCWSTQESAIGNAVSSCEALDVHAVSVTFWALPALARGFEGFGIAFPALRLFDLNSEGKADWLDKVRRLALPQKTTTRTQAPIPPREKERRYANRKDGFDPRGVEDALPSEQLMCIDNPTFLAPITPRSLDVEDDNDDALPNEDQSWKLVGQHLRFNSKVEVIADEYLMRIFGVEEPEEIPAFIAVHVRGGPEFAAMTGGHVSVDKYAAALQRLHGKMEDRARRLSHASKKNGRPHHAPRGASHDARASKLEIVATTDDPEVAHGLRGLGWRVIDHEALRTVHQFGSWWPTILDSSILARAVGFVGTDRSAFSQLAALRVKYWNDGMVEFAAPN